ncbi:DUF3025 domain-containing protein [Variovorax sp. KK3]|nr:DUF3025 domain-containing protein [Variovorax sp. KK3]
MDAFRAVDLTAPWFAPWRDTGSGVLSSVLHGATVAQALDAHAGSVGRTFVPHHCLAPGRAYEAHIAQSGAVPTRDNLHDFFNGLAWLRFPGTKQRLNELQAAEIARDGVCATRGPLRDALTLFDENGAVLDAPAALWAALLARDWKRLFVHERPLWREARLLVFGHALLEKLVAPRKALTAHVLWAPGAVHAISVDDSAMAAELDPRHLRGKPFAPLPVLGVPGWWAANEGPGFYDDAAVFRPPGPPRRPRPGSLLYPE